MKESPVAALGNLCASAMREKEWEEMELEEKVERLKRLVESNIRQLKYLDQRTTRLHNHDHLNGRLVIPIQQV